MKMNMKKLMLATVLAAISSQSFAALTSHGTATTSITFKPAAEWSIRTGATAEGTVNMAGVLDNDSAHLPTLIVRNGTATDANYYLKGSGESLPHSSGSKAPLFVHETDKTQTFPINSFSTDTSTTWSVADEAYKSKEKLAAGAEKTLAFDFLRGTEGIAGKYNVTLELLTETP